MYSWLENPLSQNLMGFSLVWVCSYLVKFQLWENPFLQNWHLNDFSHCSLVYAYVYPIHLNGFPPVNVCSCLLRFPFQENLFSQNLPFNVYIHAHSSFHFKKIFSHKIYNLMASKQNVCTFVQSTFHFKKIFSHNIYIWKASLKRSSECIHSSCH